VSGGWAYSNDKAYNGSKSISESPAASYASNAIKTCQRSSNFDLSGAGSAYLSFWVRYRSENFHDKLKVQVSTDGTTWATVGGRNTIREPGNNDGSTIADTPSLTGIRIYWTREIFDLTPYVGSSALRLRFQFTSDNSSMYTYGTDEGFNIDDVAVFAGAAPSSLPVELTDFTGHNEGEKNILEWHTASEFQTDKFILERSANGLNFETTGEVDAAGNSRASQSYSFTDEEPFQGNNFYRLKILDEDGTFEYSRIILLKTENTNRFPTGIQSIYPNPTTGQSHISFYEAENNHEYLMRIYSVNGQIMQEEKISMNNGKNEISVNSQDYPAGQYIVQFSDLQNGVSYENKLIRF
jgi:hypothetical protein